MANRDTAKTYFETGDKPTQAQFWQLFDWLFFKDESIAIANVTNLQTVLNGKAQQADMDALKALVQPYKVELSVDGTYELPAGYAIEYLVITPTIQSAIKVGVTNGGEEIMAEETIEADEDYPVMFFLPTRVNKTIYFTGIAAATTILIYRKSLTPIN